MLVVFENGTEDQKAQVISAMVTAGADLARSIPHTVTVKFSTNPGGNDHFFALTTVYDGATATIDIDHGFPNFVPPFDGLAFAIEVVVHEMAHIVQSFLSTIDQSALIALFQPPGGTWQTGPWDHRVIEADAETAKDSLTVAGISRKYKNRANYHITSEAAWEEWRDIHNAAINPVWGDVVHPGVGGAQRVEELGNLVVTTHTATDLGFDAFSGTERYSHVYTHTWTATYDTQYGLMLGAFGRLFPKIRVVTPDPFSTAFLSIFHRLTWSEGGGDPAPQAIGSSPPDPDADPTIWTPYNLDLPVGGSPWLDFEGLLLRPEDNLNVLPWVYEYTVTQIITSGDPSGPDDGTPLVELAIDNAYVGWQPHGIIGEYVSPPTEPPPFLPYQATGNIELALLSSGRRRLQRRIGGATCDGPRFLS